MAVTRAEMSASLRNNAINLGPKLDGPSLKTSHLTGAQQTNTCN